MPLVRPLCQNPPVAHDRHGTPVASRMQRGGRSAPQPVAEDAGAQVEGLEAGEGMAADVRAHVHRADLLLQQLERGEQGTLGATGAKAGRSFRHAGGQLRGGKQGLLGYRIQQAGAVLFDEGANPFLEHRAGVFARHGEGTLAQDARLQVGAAKELVGGLLDMLGLAFLHDQKGALARCESHELLLDEGVGGVEHVQRQPRAAEAVRQAQQFQGPKDAVVEPALQHDPEFAFRTVYEFVELVFLNEAHRRRPALFGLLAFVLVGVGWQDDARRVALRRVKGVCGGERRPAVVAGDEAPVQMAGADAQHQHHRRIAGLGQFEALLHRVHDAVQAGVWGRAARAAISSRRRGCAPA